MAEFSATVYQNEFLPDGGTDVHAIVTVACSGAGTAGQSGSGDAGEIIIVDTSGSMGAEGVRAAAYAAQTALDQILDGVWFAVISGNDRAQLAFPATTEPVMVRMDPRTRQAAKEAVAKFYADGGTAMGTWLRLASRVFATVPSLTQKHAILLTDGENQHESPEVLTQTIEAVTGQFQCDCRGVGVAWQVDEVRRIATALLGTVDIIPAPDQLAAEFSRLIQSSMSKGVASADLRVWAPQGAQVLFVRQVAPAVDDLTSRRTQVNALTASYPTGSWGDESRDYHVAIRLAAKGIGQEQLAARVQLAVGEQVLAQGLVKALWSADEALTTRISPEVAHYTGQTELANAIQEGLAAKAAGDTATATTKLGRAVQLAAQTGNEEATTRLRKVVEIDDQDTGTVRLKRSIEKADEMALDTASTKTTRVRK
ncbi:von Willebrand factor type A domain-containing protein [Kribbella amoyensis]|uniref:von Willebrand factor type A domain-containing protein n=1 Tax=Kribbella amoyensis TaxID=996641 RepID=A0A561BKD8_9ACTN|nr:VWA domain-containing protein [Kribbella amoyensis]TWD79347.1 von Willebrand factor type A domain-containing protein [Kribbella amoyensis]